MRTLPFLFNLRAPLIIAPLLVAPLFASPGTPSTPELIPLARYQSLIQRSPFSPASNAPAPAPTVSFAKDYYLTGMATVGEKAFITLSTRDNQTRFSLLEGETYNGITFTTAEWAPGVGRSRAVLNKEGVSGIVTFDEVSMKAAPLPAQPATVAGQQPQGNQGNQGGWGRRGGHNGGERRSRGNWGSREQRQYMRENRRAWFRAMQQNQQAQQSQQGGQQQHQRQQPINTPQGR